VSLFPWPLPVTALHVPVRALAKHVGKKRKEMSALMFLLDLGERQANRG